MWATLALAAALNSAPAQTGAFSLKNARPSYGVLGQTRPDAKFLGGDLLILNYDLQNLKVPDDGIVQYSLALEVTNKAGKSIYKLEPQEFKAELTLGGTGRPALSIYELPLDMPAGNYIFTVTGTDLLAKQSNKLEFPFEVLSNRLGFIQSGIHIPVNQALIPSPFTIPVGQTVILGTAVVGFELGPKTESDLKKRQPNLVIETRIIDEATGKATMTKPKRGVVIEVGEEFKKVVPFTTPLELNRPGKYKIAMKVTDNHSQKTAELTLNVTVYEIKQGQAGALKVRHFGELLMSQLQERIDQFRKMANDDPDNELGHYRLGQLLQEAQQYDQAVASYKRTLELSPHFSKVYQLLGQTLISAGKNEDAIAVLQQGFDVADERGDKMPRDEMARLLVTLGQPAPVSKKAAAPTEATGPGTGFKCKRAMCLSGSHARQLPAPPIPDDIGKRIQAEICADCWNDWFRNQSIKVINELRLDLSTERGQEEYDRYMSEFFGFEA